MAFPDPILLWSTAPGHILKTNIPSFPTTRISSFLDSPELFLHLSQSDPEECPALFLLHGAEAAQRHVLTKTLIGHVLYITPHPEVTLHQIKYFPAAHQHSVGIGGPS